MELLESLLYLQCDFANLIFYKSSAWRLTHWNSMCVTVLSCLAKLSLMKTHSDAWNSFYHSSIIVPMHCEKVLFICIPEHSHPLIDRMSTVYAGGPFMWVCTCAFVCQNMIKNLIIWEVSFIWENPIKESCDLCLFKATKLFLDCDFVTPPGIANRSEFMK